MKSDSSNAAPQIILVGLGKMGGNMARRLARGGVLVLGVDPQLDANDALAREPGVTLKASLAEAIAAAPRPRSVWLMLPAGVITESTLAQLETMLGAGDLVVDGGNANYLDSQRRGARFAGLGIEFADCGVHRKRRSACSPSCWPWPPGRSRAGCTPGRWGPGISRR
jgi:6-phosphogluconate dehydrogenase